MYKRQPAEFTHTGNLILKYLVRTSVHSLKAWWSNLAWVSNWPSLWSRERFPGGASAVQRRCLLVSRHEARSRSVHTPPSPAREPTTLGLGSSSPSALPTRRPLAVHQLLESWSRNVHMRCYTKNTLPAECMQFAAPSVSPIYDDSLLCLNV